MVSQRETICNILASILGLEKKMVQELGDGENLIIIGFDSISAIQLVVNLEQQFNIQLNDDDLVFNRLDTIAKIQQLVICYIKEKVEML